MPPTDGKRFAGSLLDLITEGRIKAAGHVADVHHATRNKYLTDFMEAGEDEHREIAQGLMAALGGVEDLPEGLAELFSRATSTEAQFDWILQILLLGAVLMFNAGPMTAPIAQQYVNRINADHPDIPLSAADLALAVVRGVMPYGDAQAEAEWTGIAAGRFATLVDNTGGPPGLQELLYLLRRGAIDDGTFEKGIRQSNYRNEWIGTIKQLAYVPPAASEVMAAAVASQLDLGQARALWAENGLTADSFDWVYNTTGPPPPTQELIELWRRGDVTEAEVNEALLEGPLKIKWIPTVMKFKRRVPPMEQVIALTRRGVFTAEQATGHLADLGFDPDVVAGLVTYATSGKVDAHKDLAISTVTSGYRDGLISRADAGVAISGHGYDPADTELVLAVADSQIAHEVAGAAVTRVRSLYVARHLDRAKASADLDVLGVPAEHRDRMLGVWDVMRSETAKEPTLAQWTAFLTKGLIDAARYRVAVSDLGYSPEVVDLFVALHAPTT